MEQAVIDLKLADKKIKKKHRYFCGLVSEEQKDAIGSGDFFFESPDGQNGELFYELRSLGYRSAGHNAEYNWKVRKDGILIEYLEGDIYIRKIKI